MSLHDSTPALHPALLSPQQEAEAARLSKGWLQTKERLRLAEVAAKDAKAKLEACKTQLAALLGETGKDGRRIGPYRVTNIRRTRQDIDRSVLKAEHPEVYESVRKIVAWEQLAVEYVPDVVVTPPVPQMWQASPAEPDSEDLPF